MFICRFRLWSTIYIYIQPQQADFSEESISLWWRLQQLNNTSKKPNNKKTAKIRCKDRDNKVTQESILFARVVGGNVAEEKG